MCEGEFVNMRTHNPAKAGAAYMVQSSDTYSSIDWLITHVPHNKGTAGMWGISLPGFSVSSGMIDAHPALRAVSPHAPISDLFIGDDFHHNWAFHLPHAFNFFANFGHARPRSTTESTRAFKHGTEDGYKFFLDLGA